jgi:hypothetical protein
MVSLSDSSNSMIRCSKPLTCTSSIMALECIAPSGTNLAYNYLIFFPHQSAVFSSIRRIFVYYYKLFYAVKIHKDAKKQALFVFIQLMRKINNKMFHPGASLSRFYFLASSAHNLHIRTVNFLRVEQQQSI